MILLLLMFDAFEDPTLVHSVIDFVKDDIILFHSRGVGEVECVCAVSSPNESSPRESRYF